MITKTVIANLLGRAKIELGIDVGDQCEQQLAKFLAREIDEFQVICQERQWMDTKLKELQQKCRHLDVVWKVDDRNNGICTGCRAEVCR